MERYIQQLIQDLLEVANTEPLAAYIEPPPHLENKRDIAELALVPFKSIEELTGISSEAFPHMNDLTGGQCQAVNAAIFKVFDTFHIELVDQPEDIPPEWLYDVLTTNWDYPVQYLPETGFDLELCSGNPATCEYGEFCDCGEDYTFPEEDEPMGDYNKDELPF